MNNQSFFLVGAQRFALFQRTACQRYLCIKSILALALLLALVLATQPEQVYATDTIEIRLSYKVIRDPTGATVITSTRIDDIIDGMNDLQEQYFRGFRFVPAEPVQEIGDMADPDGPIKWSNVDFLHDKVEFVIPGTDLHEDVTTTIDARNALEHEAMNNKRLYKWNDRAINIYINAGTTGGKCAFPTLSIFGGGHAIAIGKNSGASIHLHEIGHYFGLRHTHEPGVNLLLFDIGEENVKDTIKDNEDWNSKEKIADENFGIPFGSLSPDQEKKVLDVWENIMSYHHLHGSVLTRLTEGQLDKWTSALNLSRQEVVDGRVILVNKSGGVFETEPESPHRPGLVDFKPLARIDLAQSVARREKGRIILIAPGRYSKTLPFNKPITLRATRRGTVTIDANR